MVNFRILSAAALFLLPLALSARDTAAVSASQHWEISGTLAEACTCAVPCTCNFGQGPSPHHYCHFVLSLQIDKGHYGNVKLDTLRLATAEAQEGRVAYIDERATPAQAQSLRAIARRIFGERLAGKIETAKITQESSERAIRVQIAGKGGFDANILMSRDGKSPIIVENNASFNVPKTTKSKTTAFRYSDAYGNQIDVRGTNGNKGHFDWTDQSEFYF